MKTTIYLKMGDMYIDDAIEFVRQSGNVVVTGWTRVNGLYAIDIADTIDYDVVMAYDYETWQFKRPGVWGF
jgi:hypothetical protein